MKSDRPTIFLMASVKNEAPFMLEFVAHHLELGFSRIFIASNDCDDGTDLVLDAMDAAGYVTHVRAYPKAGQVPQTIGYEAIRKAHPIDDADWLMVLDADEFLNVHIGDNTVAALVAAAGDDVDIVALNAATFGSKGQVNWRRQMVAKMFQYRHESQTKLNEGVKSLTRSPRDYKAIHGHSMVGYKGPSNPLRVLCGDGEAYDLDMSKPLWRQLRSFSPKVISHDIAQYNHYAIKTYDTFCLRQARGRGGVPIGAQPPRHTDAYFLRLDTADVHDDTIGRYRPAVAARIAEMLAVPAIARCHRAAEQGYRRRLAPYQGKRPSAGE